STIEFLSELRDQFTEFVRVFNVYSENGTRFHEVKIYNLANSAADFMVFRNQIKLLVANSAHGVIQISFAQHVRNTLAINGQSPATSNAPIGPGTQELLAQVGPFRNV